MTQNLKKITVLATAILVIASLTSIGMMQANNAAAAGITIYKLKENSAYAQERIEEGSISTQVYALAFETTSGDKIICVGMSKYDSSTDTYPTNFEDCGPASQLNIANSLNTATFSGTITGFDYATGEDNTVTVNADLTATGKAYSYTSGSHSITPDSKVVVHEQGRNRDASGSVNISGDLTFSTDDATGKIIKVNSGSVQVERV